MGWKTIMLQDKNTDIRLSQIDNWLKSQFSLTSFHFELASSDASFRRYFRVTANDKTWILMDAPPEQEDTNPFTKVASFLFQHGINVPEIVAKDKDLGLLLLTDFGSTAYLDRLNSHSVDALYRSAINSLIDIQLIKSNDIELADYDEALLQQEMDLFPNWFLDRHFGITSPPFLQQTFDALIKNAIEQPQVIVHRDYHSRNLMHTNDNSPGIIDFQDAVIGPISYDLVSLLRDCYISWPQQKLNEFIGYYLSRSQAKGLLLGLSTEQFTRWFDLMGLQRHIKVLGIFCRLNYRDNKPNYINDLPLTLNYVKQVSAKYPEFSQLHHFLSEHPVIGAIK